MNIGIVGCGAVTSLSYAPALELLENEDLLQVTTLYDPDSSAMARIARSFPGARRVGQIDELLQGDVGLVIIASPPRHHAEQVILALRSGRSVLCEEPLAMTTAEGRSMIEAAAEARSVLAVGMVHRFFQATRTIQHLLGQRILGDLQQVHVFEAGSYFDPSEAGGVFRDIGSHVLDLLTWWFGSPGSFHYEDDAMGGVEANCRFRLTYHGFECTVRLTRDWARPNHYFFQGSRGWLQWIPSQVDRLRVGFHDSPHPAGLQLGEATMIEGLPAVGGTPVTYHQCFVEQIRNVVSVVLGQEAPVVTGEQALKVVRLVEEGYRERRMLPMPWLNEREQQAALQLIRSRT